VIEGRKILGGIKMCVVVEVQFLIKVETEILLDRFGERMGPSTKERLIEGFGVWCNLIK